MQSDYGPPAPACFICHDSCLFCCCGATALGMTVSKAAEGVMKHSKSKKQPSRHEYALALKTIRAQYQTIESQSDTIRRQNQFMVTIWMDDQAPTKHGRSHDKAWHGSPSRWIN